MNIFNFTVQKLPQANNVDPDQMPHFVASELGLHCLRKSLKWVSGLKRVSNHSEKKVYRSELIIC